MPNKRRHTTLNFEKFYKTCSPISDCESNSTNEKTIDFSCILNKKWRIFKASPIHNFYHDNLKRYEIKLCTELHAIKNFNSKKIYHCKFSLNDKLTLNNEHNEALKVEVFDEQSQSIYCAYFISWTKIKKINEEYISLPIVLVESKSKNLHSIHFILCKMFDCDIHPVIFPTHALITFFVNLLQSPRKSNDISKELLYLEYKIPDGKACDKLKVTLFLEDITIVLAVIIDSLREKFKFLKSREIILEFYNRIMTHLYNLYHLELMRAELYKVVFSDAFITNDGQLKLSTNEVAFTVFEDLYRFFGLDKLVSE